MNARLVAVVVAGALAASFALRADLHAETNVLVCKADVSDEPTLKSAADVVAKRCKHAGWDVAAVERTKDGIRVRGGPAFAECEAQVRRLVERRGVVEFRVRAEGPVEDMWRDKRLNEGGAPPAGLEWRQPSDGAVQVLVEVPEAAFAARLDAAKKTNDATAVKSASADYDKALAESVFDNRQIATTSVQRTMKSWGAQRFLHVAVRFEFKDDRKAAFEKFTGDHLGRPLCVVADGKVLFAPKIGAALPGTGELTGGATFGEDQAQELAAILESGPLPCGLTVASDK